MPEIDEPTAPVQARRRKRQSRTIGPGREFRRFATSGLEVRSATNSDTITISGVPIVYETPYVVCDMFGEFTETMHAGVVTNLLATKPDVRFLFNHEGMPLARTLSGTLALTDTATGLSISATLDARSQLACDLAIAIERGDVSQMSCGFVVGMDTWNDDYTQRDIWRLEDLFDVSAVTYPASPTTSVELALRSLMAAPVESRARLRQVWIAAREAREGKVLSAENAGLLQQALDALHEADDVDIPSIVRSLQTIDDALDQGQSAVSAVLGKANPDDDDSEGDEMTDVNEDGTAGGNTDLPGLADATGTRSTVPASRQERRDASAGRSFNDIERAVSDAIAAAYGDPDDDWYDMWLEDCGDGWAVFHCWETNPGVGLWRVSYSLDTDGVATLGDDLVQVIEQTTYMPVARSRNVALELEAEQLRLRRRRGVA